MLIIFDTSDGLCNQIWDIFCGVNFCQKYNINFTFRYASFRDDKCLHKFYKVPFNNLFDIDFYKTFPQYVNFDDIKEDYKNDVYNYNGLPCFMLLDKEKDILQQIKDINNKNIVISKFRSIYPVVYENKGLEFIDFCQYINPNNHIMNLYKKIKNTILKSDEKYNFIHYRYEKDFTDYFKIDIKNIKTILEEIKYKNNYKIFIASSNVNKIIDEFLVNEDYYNKIIYKNDNDDILTCLNFEEKAFIDFMFGKNSEEVYGHKMSSFSIVLNNLKGTTNYY